MGNPQKASRIYFPVSNGELSLEKHPITGNIVDAALGLTHSIFGLSSYLFSMAIDLRNRGEFFLLV